MKLPCYCETLGASDKRIHDFHYENEEGQEIGVGFDGEEQVLLEE